MSKMRQRKRAVMHNSQVRQTVRDLTIWRMFRNAFSRVFDVVKATH